jgi:creatinine amidohydrolase
MNTQFIEKTWPEVEEFLKKNALVILPVAQVEEHGPHLPLGCDTIIGTEIGKKVSKEVNKVIPTLLMPTVWAGYSPKKMMKWPGTMRIRPKVIGDYIHDIIGSLCEMGFTKIVIIDSHGQHRGILEVAIRTWGIQESESGIYGTPSVSSKKTGEVLMQEIIKNYTELCKEYYKIKTF